MQHTEQSTAQAPVIVMAAEFSAELEKDSLITRDHKSSISSGATSLNISLLQRESVKQQKCSIELLEGTVMDRKYTMSCIVCYTEVKVAEYKDLEHSMCVIEVEQEEGSDGYITLPCCNRLLCNNCVKNVMTTVINEGRVNIVCPHPECGESFTKEYVNEALSSSMKLKYRRLMVDKENDGKIKTCPNCSHLTEHKLSRGFWAKEADLKITCEVCKQEWCFRCHAPWHTGRSCKEFKSGSTDFKRWTKSTNRGVPNCQKCPTCRVYIQRSTGCPHMTCDRCGTEFCYDCGGRYIDFGFDIDHYSTLNVWGCPENYYPDNSCFRNTVRWCYLFTKISYLIAYPALFVLVLALFLVFLVVCIPCYCCCKICSICCYAKRIKGRSTYRRF